MKKRVSPTRVRINGNVFIVSINCMGATGAGSKDRTDQMLC
jgi:hypothetical protein